MAAPEGLSERHVRAADDAGAGPRVAVIDYGIGNLRSAQKAFERCGADAVLTADHDLIAAADAVVLPGVGAYGACVDALERCGLTDVAIAAARSGRPFLGICVGMQLLYEGSSESPEHRGLGVFPGTVELLPDTVKRPQMQWNRLVSSEPDHPLLHGVDDAWMYFVHSYFAPNDERVIATCDYGIAVPAVVAEHAVWATQFHPEKSGRAGLALISNFLAHISGVAC